MASYLSPGDDPTAGAVPALNPIAVTDIVSLGVPVEWPEALAVVAELCTVLQAAESATWVPEPEDVLITAHGTVIIRRGGGGTHDVDELGRMLHSLLDPSRTPMPIRLFLTQSIGFNRYTTVQAYADALAYYERPGRTELVQSLYHRCLETPPEALTPRAPAVLDEEAVPDAEPRRPRRRHGLAVAVALVSGLAAAAGVWVWQAGMPVGVSVAAFKEAVTAAASAAVEQVGWEAAPTSGELIEGAEPGRPEPRRTRTVAQVPRRTPAAADPIADVSSLRPQLLAPPSIAIDPAPTVEGGFAIAPVGPAAPVTVAPDPTVYSEVSEGVEPPVMYFPQLPPVMPAGDDSRRLNTMELLVDERGAVQAAKLTSRPVRLPDMTLLSAAKTWKFHPATKDGRPVKYRLSVSWSVTPP